MKLPAGCLGYCREKSDDAYDLSFCIFLMIINVGLFYFLTDVLRCVFSACPLVNKAKQESLPTSRSRSHNRSQVSCTGTLTYICCRDCSHIFPWTEEKERLISLSSIGFLLQSSVCVSKTSPVLVFTLVMYWFIWLSQSANLNRLSCVKTFSSFRAASLRYLFGIPSACFSNQLRDLMYLSRFKPPPSPLTDCMTLNSPQRRCNAT